MADIEHGRASAKEILLLGGGFGGVYAALELEKLPHHQSGAIRVRLAVSVTSGVRVCARVKSGVPNSPCGVEAEQRS